MRHPSLRGRTARVAAAVATVVLAMTVTASPASGAGAPALVKDIFPGGHGSLPDDLVNVAGTLFFTAVDGVHGRELWKSDGTPSGTRMVRDIRPGSAYSSPRELTVAGTRLFFTASDGIHGREVWVSDGTRAGTRMVRAISPSGEHGSAPSDLVAVGRNVFFWSDIGPPPTCLMCNDRNQLWMSDGTRAGTRRVLVGPYVGYQASIGRRLFFTYEDWVGSLWTTDGTVSKAVQGMPDGVPYDLTVVGKTLYFGVESYPDRNSLWKTDGMRDGTTRLLHQQPADLTRFGARLAFISGHTWDQLWVSDGSAAGTQRIADIGPSDTTDWPEAEMEVAGRELFIANYDADDGLGRLWRTDGTSDGTEVINEIGGMMLTGVGDMLCYVNDDGSGTWGQLWRSDGTASGTYIVTTFGSQPQGLTAIGDKLFFTVGDGVHGRELWSYEP